MEKMLTVPEVAQRLDLAPHTIRRYIWRGALPAAKFGRLWRIDPEDLKKFIEERKQPRPP